MVKSSRLVLTAAALLATPAAWASPMVYSFTGSLQSFTAVEAGTYVFTAFGAQGGSVTVAGTAGGLGASVDAQFSLSAGTTLSIVVGGAGTSNGDGAGAAAATAARA